MTQTLTTLKNGLRIITDHVPDMHSVALGVWCDVGTRYEDMSQNGIAHLVEHMMFKGTKTRTAQQIAAEIEAVGGQMNAYTSRETTAYYVHLLKQDTALALDVLADMMKNSTFPPEELEKERHVITQEIGMCLDTPDDLIFDLHQSTAFPKQALGAPILGTAEIIAAMPRAALFNYIKAHYTPANMVISAAGYVDHENFVKLVEDLFGSLTAQTPPPVAAPACYEGGSVLERKELEQTHIVLGFEGISRLSEDYEAAFLLSSALGGGMSSRLFQEVRETRGLAYSVYSSHDAYRDCGLFEIYAGTAPERLEELRGVIGDELKKLQDSLISTQELESVKAQARAGLLMGLESMISRANRQAKHLLTFGTLPDISRTIEQLNAVTTIDIQRLAQTLFSAPKTEAVLGGVVPPTLSP